MVTQMKVFKSICSSLIATALIFTIGVSAVLQTGCIDADSANNVTQNNSTSAEQKFKLNFILNGGWFVGEAISEFVANTLVILPTNLEREGYIFIGWFDNEDFSGKAYTEIAANYARSDKTFWAKWEKIDPVTYSVFLHLNGGNFANGDNDIKSYKEGDEINLPKPVKQGFIFDGWYDNDIFSGSAVDKISSDDRGNKNFYAKWIADSVADQPTKKYFNVSFDMNYPEADESTVITVESGQTVVEPVVNKRLGYRFIGWYTEESGGEEFNFTQGITCSFTLYAHWERETYEVIFELDGGKINNGYFNSYTFGESKPLPTDVTKDDFLFDGWYLDSDCSGNKITEISADSTGNKTFYASWKEDTAQSQDPDQLSVLDFGGYEEGAFITLNLLRNKNVGDYTVKYRPYDGVSAYVNIDDELVRVVDGSVRADILGLTPDNGVDGKYEICVEVDGKSITEIVQVSAYDRSGYAHFNELNIGGYNADGTLKDKAVVIYVNEDTKNTVTETVGNSVLQGIANILSGSEKFGERPVVVRILGTVGAATWNEINYDKDGNFGDGTDYNNDNKLPTEKVKGRNGLQLPNDHKDITQEELISGNYNSLNTSEYSELLGLDSKIIWDDKNKEYDSAWNNCIIKNANNVTIEGVGTDARIFQWGLTWKNCNSIEVRNITFEDYTEDACSFEGSDVDSSLVTDLESYTSKMLWVHNNTFLQGKNYWDVSAEQDKHEGDGATDFKKNAYITLSYNHYFENHKTGLIGSGDEQKTACVTFHHNWYENCNSRLPMARQANMHMYNNYYEGSTGTNMSLRAGAYAFIENCYFCNVNKPIETQEGDGKKGVAKVYNCIFEGNNISSDYLNKTVFIVDKRNQTVNNDNIFNKNFDTDINYFYYDEVEEETIVDFGFDMLPTEMVKTVIPLVSGARKTVRQ